MDDSQTTSNFFVAFLRSHDLINVTALEAKLGMPKSTLQKVVNGKRPLSKYWASKLKWFVETKQYITVTRKPRENKKGTKKNTAADEQTEQVKIDAEEPKPNDFRDQLRRKKLGLK